MQKVLCGTGVLAPVVLLSAVVLVIAATAGCSSSSDPSGPTPSPTGNDVSGNGSVPVGGQTATMMINIAAGTTRAPQTAVGRLHIGVNEFENLTGEYSPELDHQVALTSASGVTAASPYAFIGKLEGSTITGTLSGGAVSGEVPVSLAASSVPIEAVVLLGPWDFTHEVRVATLAGGIDPCPVPSEFRTITDSCADRYQVEIEGNMLPAVSCRENCLPSVDMAGGSLEGNKLTLHLPEVGEPTTPANRLFSMNLPGCNVIWTGQVELDARTGDTTLVNLVSECQGSGDSCDPYCTNGRLDPACAVSYELELTRCVGGSCACPS